MKKVNWKLTALAALLGALLLGATGCFSNPGAVDAIPTNPIDVLPFAIAISTPLPDLNLQPGLGDQQSETEDQVNAETYPLTSAPSIEIIIPSPTPPPVWTYVPPTAIPTPTDDGTLRNGSTGQAVRQLQQRLKDLRYYTGSVDGDFGAITESALRDFQRQNGLSVDGVAGPRTFAAMNSSNAKAKSRVTSAPTTKPYATSRPAPKSYTPSTPGRYRTLQLGSGHTADVRKLQQRLKSLGYYSGSVNGNYDETTEAAVTAFQRRNGEWVDGVAGEDTQRRLFSDSALPFASIANDQVPSLTRLPDGSHGRLRVS